MGIRQVLRSVEKKAADPEYLDFFGLTRPPFARLVETSKMFQSEQYSLLMEHLASATEHNDSRVVIRGVDGSGKSTLLDHYITALGDHVNFVAINETCRSAESFYSEFLKQIGFNEIGGTIAELQNITKEFLVYRGNAGDPVLLIIDNAHLIDPIILEQLRWICGIKVDDHRVLSVVLAGNADVVRIIDAPAMRQVKFDRHVVFSIRNFTEEETAGYVWHRLNLAGGNDGVKIANQAHPLVHRYSGGIPQLINTLCNDMLTEAFRQESRVITGKIVRTVADEQRLVPHVIPAHGKGRRRSDPDFEPVEAVPATVETPEPREPKRTESRDSQEAEPAAMDPKSSAQHISQLSEQVADLRADKERALQEIGSRNKDIEELREKLGENSEEIKKLTRSLAVAAKELAQHKQAASEAAAALRTRDNAAKKFAALFETEKSKRELAESEFAKAAASLNELLPLRKELAGRDKTLAELESRLAKVDTEYASAQNRIADLRDPEDLRQIEEFSAQLASELEEERRKRETAEADLARSSASVEESRQLEANLKARISNLEAELKTATARVVDFEILERGAAELEEQIKGKDDELESIREETALREKDIANLEKHLATSQSACELAQRRILELKSPQELEQIEKFSDRLAADLEKEKRIRMVAETERDEATVAVNELNTLTGDLQGTVDDLSAKLKAADERVAELGVNEKQSADLREQLEKSTAELDSLRDILASRDEAVADLERRLADSKKEYASAQSQIAVLKDPEDVQEIERLSGQLAADLEDEKRTREAAEQKLEDAKSNVEKLTGQTADLQATITDLEERLEAANESATEAEALEKITAELKAEIEERNSDLTSLRDELASRDEALVELDSLREELAARDKAVAGIEKQLTKSKKKYESAKSRIAALKKPDDQSEIEALSHNLSSELEDERRLREVAETQLEEVTARIDELNDLEEEWRSTVDDLKEELEYERERAAGSDVLEKSNAALKALIDEKSEELVSLQEKMAEQEQALEDDRGRSKVSQSQREAAKRGVVGSKGPAKTASKKAAKSSDPEPRVYPSQVVERFEQSIRDVGAYKSLRKYDLAFYSRLIARYKALIGQDLSDKQVNDALRKMQASYIEKRLSGASDGAVTDYARIIVDQLDEFDSNDTEPCFTLLIPPDDNKYGPPPVYSESTRDDELAVLEKTVRTYKADRPIPSEENVWPSLEPIFADLFDEFGEENVSALQNLDDPGIDRKLLCRVGSALYRGILDLPKRKSVNALRWILSA